MAEAEAARKEAVEAQKKAQEAQSKSEKTLEKAKFVAKRVKVLSLKSKKSGQVTMNWKPIAGAEGYIIKYADNSSFRKSVKVTIGKGTVKKKTIKKLQSGKKYYFRIRAYSTFNGKKIYSMTGNKKTVKVK